MNAALKILPMLSIAFASTCLSAQQHFQIATIKESAPGTEKHTRSVGTRFSTTGTTVEDLLKFAYSVRSTQVLGGPEWIRTTQYDVLADPEMMGRPSLDELRAMTANLLTERFHLVLRKERQELPVYMLVQGKNEVKLTARPADPSSIVSGALVPPGNLYVHGGTTGDFVKYLQRFAPPEIDRPIVDRTGILGRFEFELHYTPDAVTSEQTTASDRDAALPPRIFTAMEEQLGLRLKATKASVDVLDVVSISTPSPN